MNYITTATNLETLGANLKATDKVYIFYKGSDMLKVDTIIDLLKIKAQKEFIKYTRKEELMINFGYLVAKMGSFKVLDATIPVPDLLKDKASTKTPSRSKKVEQKTTEPVKRGRKKKENVTETVTKSVKKETTKVETKAEAPKKRGRKKKESDEILSETKPETRPIKKDPVESNESDAQMVLKEGKSDDPIVEALKKILPVRASDFQYSMGTNFMMGRIKLYVSESKDDEDLRRALDFNFRGDKDHKVSTAVLNYIKKVRKVVASEK